jgi:hypothetical protein
MSLKLDAKYKKLISIIVITCYGITVAICFITLPPIGALIITIICSVLIILANKIIYRFNIVWVHPTWNIQLMNLWLGGAWFSEDIDGISKTGLALLYEKKPAAKDIYRMLRSWTNGKLNDVNGDIKISLVRESKTKYTIIIFPGKRIVSRSMLEKAAKNKFPKNSEININELMPFITICVDYSNKPHIIDLINNLQHERYLLLTTLYVKDEKIVEYSKSFIRAYGFRVVERDQLNSNELEYHTCWNDPKKKFPVLYSRVKLLEKNIEPLRD